jgi:hypothetical protein
MSLCLLFQYNECLSLCPGNPVYLGIYTSYSISASLLLPLHRCGFSRVRGRGGAGGEEGRREKKWRGGNRGVGQGR